jgi:hypothetical protein
MTHGSNRREKIWRPVALALGLVAISAAAIPAQAQEVICGDRIGPGRTVVLESDLGPCRGPFALRVEGLATLDLGGRTIQCLNAGIELTGRAVKVRNGRILGCTRGIVLVDGARHRVTDVRIEQGFDTAVLILPGSDRNRIEKVRVFATDPVWT